VEENNRPKTYEDCYHIIDTVINKFKKTWTLQAINWFDFDDVAQVVKLHIYKKWHMWDQTRPLEPWIARITSHQIKNIIRNNYTNYVKPCMSCPHNMGDNLCSKTRSKEQDSTCKDYAKWSKHKRQGYGIKMPLTIEHHQQEINEHADTNVNFVSSIDKIDAMLKNELSEQHFRVYKMLFFENCSEEEVAKFLGFKSNEKNRKAGYKQIKNIKKMLKEKVQEIIEKNDILV
jgi:DNA-directed RNA polymerase specialized sigma24 family protein